MQTRREFCVQMLKTGGALGVSALPLMQLVQQAQSEPVFALRPPSAIGEQDFLSACTRCGLCVRACPYDTLVLSEKTHPTWGTPYFIPREIPCEMCEDFPCVTACPTNALSQNMQDINEARMGVAVLVDQQHCLAFLGLRCEVCYNVCPLMDQAIKLERMENQRTGKHAFFIPVVDAEFCTGCGKCEQACVLPEGQPAAIQVLPSHIARSALPEHYRLGWEEKAKNNNQSLIKDTIELPIRGLELPKEFKP